MKTISYNEMLDYCESNRDKERFCRCSCACSGATYSNLTCDQKYYTNETVPFRGKCGTLFLVEKDW